MRKDIEIKGLAGKVEVGEGRAVIFIDDNGIQVNAGQEKCRLPGVFYRRQGGLSAGA